MSLISYAQNFEDVMLHRALSDVKNGFFIDVGANHPTEDSVTKAFSEMGWRGVNIEPEKELFDLLLEDRPNDINLNIAISSSLSTIDLYVSDTRGWSTTDKLAFENLKTKDSYSKTLSVKAISLDQLCLEHKITQVHFLKIDVEGAEKDVLQSFSFDSVRPWIVVVEATQPTTQLDISKEWDYILFEHDYSYAYFDGLNKYYVAKEHSERLEFFKIPPNMFDDFMTAPHRDISLRAHHWWQTATQQEEELLLKESALKESKEKIIFLTQENDKLKTTLKEVEDNYANLINSSLWKLTQPLRSLTALFQKK